MSYNNIEKWSRFDFSRRFLHIRGDFNGFQPILRKLQMLLVFDLINGERVHTGFALSKMSMLHNKIDEILITVQCSRDYLTGLQCG